MWLIDRKWGLEKYFLGIAHKVREMLDVLIVLEWNNSTEKLIGRMLKCFIKEQ